MTGASSSPRRPVWDGPETCPFCGAALENGGGAFLDHVHASPGCERGFDTWRDRVAGDLRGEWSG